MPQILPLAPNLKNISAERVQTELVKLLLSEHPDFVRDAYMLGITKVILPELDAAFLTPQHNPHHRYNVGEHLMQTLLHTRADKALRIAALLHDIGKPAAKTTDTAGIDHFHAHVEQSERIATDILKRLKFDNDTIIKVQKYIRSVCTRSALMFLRFGASARIAAFVSSAMEKPSCAEKRTARIIRNASSPNRSVASPTHRIFFCFKSSIPPNTSTIPLLSL